MKNSHYGHLPVYYYFEQYAQKFSESIAITFGNQQVSYGKLNTQANQLAHYLIQQNVQLQDCVGVFVEPGVEILIAILAIHKINAVYVPIDTEYPLGRIKNIVEQVLPSVIICSSDRQHEIDRNVEIDTINLSAINLSSFNRSNLGYSCSPDSISHIIFTSGTTGTPKGVIYSHSNLIHYIFAAQEKYHFSAEDNFLSATKHTFSISLFMLLLPLVCGGQVSIITLEQLLEPKLLAKAIEKSNFFHLGPSILKILLDFLEQDNYNSDRFNHVKHASSGGDMIPADILNRLNQIFTQAEVYSIYGSSEISCMGCTYFVPKELEIKQTLVGKPFNNVQLRVLDQHQKVVPIGVKGEIYFSGQGITQGYLNLPHRTKTSYVWLDGERFYRTGDIGRLTPQGNLQMLGRDDNQTQIHGMRIELGEIESNLNLHPAISACVVIVKEDQLGEKQLIAYLISQNQSPNIKELRSFLQASLPQYMIPAHFVLVEQFPLNPNGKVDRRALSLINYWQEQLAGIPPLLELPTDQPRSATQTYHEGIEKFNLSYELTAKLQTIGKESGTTLFMTLLASFATLLSRYSNSQDVVIGSYVDNHNHSEIEPCANTLVLRTNLEGAPSFKELLQRVRQTTLDAYAHSNIQFDNLVKVLQPECSASHAHLFQVMFVLQNQTTKAKETSNLTIKPLSIDQVTTQCDLTLLMEETSEGLIGLWQYNSDLFDAATIERMNGNFQTLLEGIVNNPQQSINRLPLLTDTERQQLFVEWNNNTYTEYSQNKCIHELFEEQVERTPDAIAVIFEDRQLTYQELNAKANQLAHYLQQLGVQPEKLVGICVERSLDTVIGILGILKAGGAYVPLDPAYPTERIAYSIANSQISMLLTHQKHLAELPEHQAKVVCFDQDRQTIVNHSSENLQTEVKSSNLAYVIYTSGSTGKPKGVLVTHDNVVRLFTATQDWYNFNHNDVWTLFHSYAFDFSVWELWGALIYGGKLVVVSYLVSRSADTFYQLLEKEGVTVLNQTPSAFKQLIQVEESANITLKLNLRYVIFGGEALEFRSLQPWFERHGDRTPQLVNMYGITETTVHVTYYPITMADLEKYNSVIGCLIPDLKLYLLDSYLQPVPIGVVGEMYVGGAGVARGYLNREELTKQRFINDPFSNKPEACLYKTGDLGRYLSDGTLEYLGRIDNQVKIRGFRIELGEIESVLAQHPDVREIVVVAREDTPGDKRLVAYIVPQPEPPHSSDLRSFVQESLPNYMVPSAFVFLDIMPLTPSGKVDRRALPAPDTSNIQLDAEFVPPSNSTEELLVTIWSDILGLKRIGVEDNFFDLGGHSLLATQIISRIREILEVEVSITSLFASPTIAALARQIDAASTKSPVTHILPTPRQGKISLSLTQQGLWFLYQLEPESSAYNIPLALEMKGVLQINDLERAIAEIVHRHEILRTNFEFTDNTPVQTINPTRDIPLKVVDLSSLSASERAAQLQHLIDKEIHRPFELTQEALLRTTLFQQTSNTQVLLVTMHHIVTDGWSLEIFTKELSAIYTAILNGQPSPLPELSIQYADFAHWQREYLQGEIYEAQLNYWRQQLAGLPPLLELPADKPRPAIQTFDGGIERFNLTPELTAKLQNISKQSGATLFMTLLAAFATLLSRYSNSQDIAIGSPIANRKRSEIEPLIGFFVNTLVLRSNLEGEPNFKELLQQVRQTTLDAYAHSDLQFDQLVEILQPERSLSYNPLFQVMFVLQNKTVTAQETSALSINSLAVDQTTAQFDLTLSMEETAEGLIGFWQYNSNLFAAETIKRLADNFLVLLEQIAACPEKSVTALPLLTTAERHKILVEFNPPEKQYSQDCCIHQLFEKQVKLNPHCVALVFEEQQITYQELNNRANQLAHYLQFLGVNSDVLVGICIERSIEMIVGLLGIIKAGGAYVPLDPHYPEERLSYMLGDSNVEVLLTQQSLVELLPTHQAKVLCLDSDWKTIAQCSQVNLNVSIGVHNLAYVIYTSGSTGKPKGVEILHKGVVNFLISMSRQPGLTEQDILLAVTTISFDIAGLELYLPLIVGAKVVLASRETTTSGVLLAKLIADSKATVMQATPATWYLLLAANWQGKTGLKVFCGGEALASELAERLLAKGLELWNMYGPTETTIWSTVHQIKPKTDDLTNKYTSELIGRPIANTQIYILDSQLQPVPIGVLGELYISGAGLARGYRHRRELTAEKFIPHPFLSGNDVARNASTEIYRIYRTGDLAKYLPDGNIEYLGRIDNQVKIRGFRIELGEIEAVLAQHPDVRETVVIPREDIPDDKRLVAYVVSQQEQLHSSDLRSFLKELLPNYMLPSAFVFLDSMPLTSNGKVDRRALPAPDNTRKESSATFVVPQDKLESHLTKIWSQILNIQPIGVRDNFFELGGNSLQAVTLFAEIEKQFGKSLPLATLFQSATIAEIAQIIRSKEWLAPWESLVPIQPNGSKPPLFYIHAGGGNLLVYRDLALALGSDQPVYGLQPRGLDGKYVPFNRIEDMAAHYLAQIRKLQPNGPYFLAGLSSGGNVGWEISQILQAQNQKVALLALFDTSGPDDYKILPPVPRLLSVLKWIMWNFLRQLSSFPKKLVHKLKQLGTKQTLIEILERFGIVQKVLGEDQKINKDKMQRIFEVKFAQYESKSNKISSSEKWINSLSLFLLKRFARGWYAEVFVRGISRNNINTINDMGKTSKIPEALQQIQEANIKARQNYIPSVYPDKVILFRASDRAPGFYDDPKLGWGDLALGGMEIYKISGDHSSIMKSSILAEKLRICLDKAQKEIYQANSKDR